MKNNSRFSGIEFVGDLPWGAHFCQFYQDTEELMEILIPYFKSGLENSEFCVWITPETLGLEEAKQLLMEFIPDFEAYFQEGQIEIISNADWYEKTYISDFNKSLKAWIERVSQADAAAYEGLRLSRDSAWSEHYRKDIIYYETEIDYTISKYKTISLCTYFLETCNVSRIVEIASNHKYTLAKNKGKWEKIENSGRIRADKAEIKLKEVYDSLEEKVRARTAELENANKSLKENERRLAEAQEMYIKEIHQRIKNNLQVISSLLSLQAEKFDDLKILEAFKESQNRVASMALIHEELYKGNTVEKLDFAVYIRKLSVNLFHSYILGNNVSLKLSLEQVFLGMDTAIPLGIIINELISNALKHAFPEGLIGELYINLYKTEDLACACEISREISGSKNKGNFNYMLRVADNGKGIPEGIRLEEAESLGFQLVSLLVDQIDGYMELKKDSGTEFVIWFNDVEISELD